MTGAPCRTFVPTFGLGLALWNSQIARLPESFWKRMSAAKLPSKSFVDATCQPAPGFPRSLWFSLPGNGLTLLPLLCQSARAPLSFTHKMSLEFRGSPKGEKNSINLPELSKSAIAATCQVGPVNGRLKPAGEVARRPPLPFSSQIALPPESLNRSRSPTDPNKLGPPDRKSPLKFPRRKSGMVVMASPPLRSNTHTAPRER